MAPLSDEELVAAAQSGDRNALDQLLRRHYDRVHAVCRRVTGGTKDADDACQEALIKISRNIGRFDGRSQFSTWAYRIATNASLDELRRRQRRPSLHSMPTGDGDDRGAQPDIVDPMAAKRFDAVADSLAIDTALGELGDDFKTAVVLRDVADLDYDEIADILDIPLGTVKSRIARGRAALADRLRLDELLGADDLDFPDQQVGQVSHTGAPLDEATGVTEVSPVDGNHPTDSQRPRDRP